MTISSTDDPRAGPFNGNGAQTAFPFEFKVFSDEDLLVVQTDADGVETELVLDSDYSVSLNADQNADPGGTVNMAVAPPTGETLTIVSDLDFTQTMDLTNGGGFYPEVVENAVDRAVMLIAQVNGKVLRSLQLAVSTPDGVDVTLPAPVAGNVLGWDADGLSLANYPPDTSTSTAELEARLVDVTDPDNGAGIPGFNRSLSYDRDTVGGRLAWDIYVTDYPWSAVGDGSTNDTTALAAAATFANALADIVSDSLDVNFYPRLIFPQCEGFITTATLVVNSGVEVVMNAPLIVRAAAGTPIIGLRYRDAKAVDYQAPRWTKSRFNVRRETQSTWPGETDIGVLVDSHYSGEMYFQRVTGFHVNVNYSGGYERLTLGELRDGKIGLLLQDRGSPDGFVNQTHVIGGSFAASGTNAGISRYGIVVRSGSGGINSLVFEGQSYELGLATAQSGNPSGEAIPLHIDGTSNPIADIRAFNQRSEVNSVTFVRCTGDVSNVEVGVLNQNTEYSDSTELMLDDDSTGSGGIVVYRQGGATAPVWETFFDTGRLVEKAVQLTGGVITIQNLESATNVGAAPATQTFAYGDFGPSFDANGDMTCAGPFYGVRVRLNGARSIAISGRKPSGAAANLKFICFDSSGAQLTTAGIINSDGTAATVNAGIYGGIYSLGVSPANTARTFNAVIGFGSTVATVFVTVESATSGWCLKRSDARPNWFSETAHMKDQFVGAAAPIALTNVTYKRGMRVAQITSAAGSPKGWVCTVPGVPTFVSEGNL